MHFQNLQCRFSPGFLAEGRRGRAQKLEKQTKKCWKHDFNIYNAVFHQEFSPKAAADKQKNLKIPIWELVWQLILHIVINIYIYGYIQYKMPYKFPISPLKAGLVDPPLE